MEPYLGEIRMFPFDYPPRGWELCDGKLMYISVNSALYSLLGTKYGGDGHRTFALPDLRGRAPVHTGIDEHDRAWHLGALGGSERVTLSRWDVPGHSHDVAASEGPATSHAPGPDHVLARSDGGKAYVTGAADLTPMAREGFAAAGGGEAHENMQPYVTLNFNICVEGLFPPRA